MDLLKYFLRGKQSTAAESGSLPELSFSKESSGSGAVSATAAARWSRQEISDQSRAESLCLRAVVPQSCPLPRKRVSSAVSSCCTAILLLVALAVTSAACMVGATVFTPVLAQEELCCLFLSWLFCPLPVLSSGWSGTNLYWR